jgi:hypothetical protein
VDFLVAARSFAPLVAQPANVVPHSRTAIRGAVKRVMADPGFDQLSA